MRIKGLYRTRDMLLGECVRVHWSAGDAAPIVSSLIYRSLGGMPDLADLPDRNEYLDKHPLCESDPLELT